MLTMPLNTTNQPIITVFIASSIVKTKFEVNRCVVYYSNGKCFEYADVPTSLTIDSPFLYNYTCSSTLLRTYIPVLISQNITVIFAVLFQFYYLSLYTKHKNEIESDTSYYGILWRLPKMLFMEHGLMIPFKQREISYIDDKADSKVLGKHDRLGRRPILAAKFIEKSWTTYTFVFADHMGSLLVLFTFGVFAPLLALSVMLSICARLYINQLVLGRRICIEAGTMAIYHERVKSGDEYVVAIDQGTAVRLKPDFTSDRLRSLHLGDSIRVAISIAEKPVSDSNLLYVKVVGEPGWVPLNAIERAGEEKGMGIARVRSSTINDKQIEYSKHCHGDLVTFRVIHSQGTFVRAEPSFQSNRVRTLFTDDEIGIDLSQQENVGSTTFVKMHKTLGWVALEALEKLSTVPVEAVAAKLTDYPMNLPLWISGQSVESMEEMIRNADSPWGATCMLEGMEQECFFLPDSVTHLCLYTFLFAFSTTAAFILNDTYNGITDLDISFWAPITIVCVVPAMIVIPYVWMKVQEFRTSNDCAQKGVGNNEIELTSPVRITGSEGMTENPILNIA